MNPKVHGKLPWLVGLAAAALFGAATPASKALLNSLSPFQLAGLLYLGAALGVIPLLLRERHLAIPWQLPGHTRRLLAGVVICGGILGPALLMVGLRLASSASVALWLNLELVATAAIGHFLFRDRLTRMSALAAGIMLAAALVLSASEGAAGIMAGALVLLACVCWGFDNHLTALIGDLSPAQTTFWKGLVAGITNLFIGVLFAAYTAGFGTSLLAIMVGVMAYGVGLVCYVASAQQLGATRSQILFSSAPFFGVVLSAIFLREHISLLQLLAVVMILAALFLLWRERHGHRHRHATQKHEHWHRHDDLHHDHDHLGVPARIGWHSHAHGHEEEVHSHRHVPDLHHRHDHHHHDHDEDEPHDLEEGG